MDGVSEDPLFDYVREFNATGVAIEADPETCARFRANQRAHPELGR